MLIVFTSFLVAYLAGFGLIGVSFYNKKRWHRMINHSGKLRTIGTVVDFDEEKSSTNGQTNKKYYIIMRYRTMSDSIITSISQNQISKPSDYAIGETLTIYYSNRNPNQFYIYENHRRQRVNILMTFAGVILFTLTTISLLVASVIIS